MDQPLPPTRRSIDTFFGDLRVRPKLMILHNLFFLILTVTVYLAVEPLVGRARLNLFLVLGGVYGGAVLLLELAIMPLYVYRPIRLMLDADQATQRGERDRELIPDGLIPGDEIGQIMRSRNATVAELRTREDDLRRKNLQLESQDRLVSLGMLSASVAHELNTPLSVLQGSIEKLAESAGDELARERLNRMLRVTQRLRRISEGLVDFARVRSWSLGPVVLNTLIDEAWSLVAFDEKAAGIRFHNGATEGHAVTGNPDRLMQVFVNLLHNSLHAVAPTGSIEVRSRAFKQGREAWVAITVEDDGPGIPPEVLPDVFEAFVSTRLDSRGTGLGLTVAQGIVHQHGGAITASNRPTGGAQLEVALPAA